MSKENVSGEREGENMKVLYGIDVSKWQFNANWETLAKKDKIDFVIPREGYREKIDSAFTYHVSEARKYGVQIPAVYHFIYATNKQEAIDEAVSALENVERMFSKRDDVIIFADYEYDSVKKAKEKEKGITISNSDINEIVNAFCMALELSGCRTGIYCNMDYYNNVFEKSIFKNRTLWIADWSGYSLGDKATFHQVKPDGRLKGIDGTVDLDRWFIYDDKEEETIKMGVTCNDVINLAKSWIGRNEKDGTHKMIIDLYNSHTPLARGYKVKYTDSWCDTFISALFIKLKATELIGGTECGCEEHVKKFKAAGIWMEDGRVTPRKGDIVVYNWDTTVQPNDGYSDHIGIVAEVNGTSVVAIEGNYQDSVKTRRFSLGWGCIRGFARPYYAEENTPPIDHVSLNKVVDEVIHGAWGNGEERRQNLEAAGYNYEEVQNEVNKRLANVYERPVDVVVDEVIQGLWGNGEARKEALETAGYSYENIQKRVNEKLKR